MCNGEECLLLFREFVFGEMSAGQRHKKKKKNSFWTEKNR